jgi:hypothetical protein
MPFYWEGKDLYVSSSESIGLSWFNKDFKYKVADELSSFDWLNFKKRRRPNNNDV